MKKNIHFIGLFSGFASVAGASALAHFALAASIVSGSMTLNLPARYTRGAQPVITQYLCDKTYLSFVNSTDSEPAMGAQGTLGGHAFTALFSATRTELDFENNTMNPPMYGGPAATFTLGKRVGGTVAVSTRGQDSTHTYSGTVTVDLTCGVPAGAAEGTTPANSASVQPAPTSSPLVPVVVGGALVAVGAVVLGSRFFGRKRGMSTKSETGAPSPRTEENVPKTFDIDQRIEDLKERRKTAGPEEAKQIDEYIEMWEGQQAVDDADRAEREYKNLQDQLQKIIDETEK